jgi:hypothetical protein
VVDEKFQSSEVSSLSTGGDTSYTKTMKVTSRLLPEKIQH